MSLPRPILTVLGHAGATVYGSDLEEGGDPVSRDRVSMGTAHRDGRAAADGTADGPALQWISSGAQPCALVTACREQETVAGARAHLCACGRHGRDRHR